MFVRSTIPNQYPRVILLCLGGDLDRRQLDRLVRRCWGEPFAPESAAVGRVPAVALTSPGELSAALNATPEDHHVTVVRFPLAADWPMPSPSESTSVVAIESHLARPNGTSRHWDWLLRSGADFTATRRAEPEAEYLDRGTGARVSRFAPGTHWWPALARPHRGSKGARIWAGPFLLSRPNANNEAEREGWFYE